MRVDVSLLTPSPPAPWLNCDLTVTARIIVADDHLALCRVCVLLPDS